MGTIADIVDSLGDIYDAAVTKSDGNTEALVAKILRDVNTIHPDYDLEDDGTSDAEEPTDEDTITVGTAATDTISVGKATSAQQPVYTGLKNPNVGTPDVQKAPVINTTAGLKARTSKAV